MVDLNLFRGNKGLGKAIIEKAKENAANRNTEQLAAHIDRWATAIMSNEQQIETLQNRIRILNKRIEAVEDGDFTLESTPQGPMIRFTDRSLDQAGPMGYPAGHPNLNNPESYNV